MCEYLTLGKVLFAAAVLLALYCLYYIRCELYDAQHKKRKPQTTEQIIRSEVKKRRECGCGWWAACPKCNEMYDRIDEDLQRGRQ
jgi:hypothetical protein